MCGSVSIHDPTSLKQLFHRNGCTTVSCSMEFPEPSMPHLWQIAVQKLQADVLASGSCMGTSLNEKSSCFHVPWCLQSWGLQWGFKLISHSLWVKIHLQQEWPPLTKSLNKCPPHAFPTVGIKFHTYDVSRPQVSLSPTHGTEIICKENRNDSHMHRTFYMLRPGLQTPSRRTFWSEDAIENRCLTRCT